MAKTIDSFIQPFLKKDLEEIKPGDTVRVHQLVLDNETNGKKNKAGKEAKTKIQIFEGIVLARKHGKGISSTITVRKMFGDIGVEKIFPLHSPNIQKIEIIQRAKVRRAKLYYLRGRIGKKAKLKKKSLKNETESKNQNEK